MNRRGRSAMRILAIVLSVVFCRVGVADESGVSRLPRDTGAVIWTTDFPQFDRRLRHEGLHPFLQLRDHFNQLQDAVDRGDLVLNTWRQEQLTSWTQANDLLLDALDARVLSGEVAICLGSSDTHASRVAIVAQTNANQEELQNLALAFQTLFQVKNTDWYEPAPIRGTEPRDAAQVARDAQEDHAQNWTLEDGWFTWSNIENDAQRLVESILEGREESQLKSNREFQMLAKRFRAESDNPGALRFYLSPQWLRTTTNRVNFGQLPYPFGVILDPLDQLSETPRSAGLNQFNSLGGRIILGQDERLAEINTLFSIEAMLLTAQPRKGILKAIKPQSGFSFTPPLPEGELGVMAQFQVEGETLVKSVSQSFREAFEDPEFSTDENTQSTMDQWRQENRLQFDWDPSLTNQLDIIGMVGTNTQTPSPRNYLDPHWMLHFRDAASVSDHVHDLALSRVQATLELPVTELSASEDRESIVWRIPIAQINAYAERTFRASYEEYIEQMVSERRAALVAEKRGAEVEQSTRELRESMHRSMLNDLNRYTGQLANLRFCLHHGWTTLEPFRSSDQLHPSSEVKLERLQQITHAMERNLGFNSKPSILVAFWSYENLYNWKRDISRDKRVGADLQLSRLRKRTLIKPEFVPSMTNLSKSRFIQEFDSLITLASHEDNGFEIRTLGIAATPAH